MHQKKRFSPGVPESLIKSHTDFLSYPDMAVTMEGAWMATVGKHAASDGDKRSAGDR